MSIFSRINDSADLMSGMASRLGIDFSDRIMAAPETAAHGYLAMILRCTGCRQQAACRQLQDAHQVLDRAPDYCRNREALVPQTSAIR